MKNKILDKTIDSIRKTYHYDEIKLKEIRYGLEAFYLSIFKLLIIVIISIILKTTNYLLLFLLTYGLLRLTGFGLHTKNSLQCWISSIMVFSLFPYLIKTITINNNCLYVLSIILLILIIIYSPADTEKRPIVNKKKRTIYKIITSITTIMYIIIIFLTNNNYLKNLLFFSILLESLLILPITYKLYNLSYNNYLLYKGKEDKK